MILMIWSLVCIYSSISELDIVEVGHVKLFPQVLSPCRVYCQLIITYGHLEHQIKWLGTPQRLTVVEPSVSPTHTLNVFTITHQHLIICLDLVGIVAPLV